MKRLGFWLRVFVSIVATALILNWINWKEFISTLRMANISYLLLVYLIIHLDRLFMALKWLIIAKSAGASINIHTAIKAYYIGAFWSYFLPASVGGDVIRIGWLTKNGQNGIIVTSSIVIERTLGMLALAIVSLGSLFFFGIYMDLRLTPLFGVILVFLIASLIAVVALFNRYMHCMVKKLVSLIPFQRASGIIEKIRISILTFKEKPSILTYFLILSVMEQTFPIAGVFLLFKAFSIEMPLMWAIIGVSIAVAVSRMPISIESIGVKEGMYALVFSFAGVTVGQAVMVSIVDRVLGILAVLPGALWTAFVPKRDLILRSVSKSSTSGEVD
ncbi:MAG: lysylphosphatidylglycerol synthase transmembrane domain-containing protein [Nitrospirota bacterium]